MDRLTSKIRNPFRLQIARRNLVETTAATVEALPVGYAEIVGTLIVMPKEGIRPRLVDGEVDRLVEAGDIMRLAG